MGYLFLLPILLSVSQAMDHPTMLGSCVLHKMAFPTGVQEVDLETDKTVCELAGVYCDDDSLTVNEWMAFMADDQLDFSSQLDFCEENAEIFAQIMNGTHPEQELLLQTVALESFYALNNVEAAESADAETQQERRRRLIEKFGIEKFGRRELFVRTRRVYRGTVGRVRRAFRWRGRRLQSVTKFSSLMKTQASTAWKQWSEDEKLSSSFLSGPVVVDAEKILSGGCEIISSAVCALDLKTLVNAFNEEEFCDANDGLVCVMDESTFTEFAAW